MEPYMLFIMACVSLTCDMVINDSVLTGEYYESEAECKNAIPNAILEYSEGKSNPMLHYYAECSDKTLGLDDLGREA